MQPLRISELMETSGVKFGTSGARGLVVDLTDRVAYAYATAFLQHLRQSGATPERTRVAVAGDRRGSTPRIKAAILRAVIDSGSEPIDAGLIPSPALALFGFQQKIPSIMVTGSHIPDDRNGIKFNTPTGEILKRDEAGIVEQRVALPFEFAPGDQLPEALRANLSVNAAPERAYVARYLDAFPERALAGLRVGVYGHSAVGRELVERILRELGADTTRLGYSEAFVSVDTEAIRPEDVALARKWCESGNFDAIVSTDGDSDRPLISDEQGRFLRGDVAGILCARYARASTVVTPVSSNTALERSGEFPRVIRTRIGSPYVIDAMLRARAQNDTSPKDDGRSGSSADGPVVGYEANGGFLSVSPIPLERAELAPLPTRDAVIVLLGILHQSLTRKGPISTLLQSLPPRYTASNRLAEFPTELSREKLASLASAGAPAVTALLGDELGPVRSIDTLDGVRIEFVSSEIVHLRASGNAPELRCYAEAATERRATELTALALDAVARWR
jgi:phosphomannomutase